jgi:hypothetical protein
MSSQVWQVRRLIENIRACDGLEYELRGVQKDRVSDQSCYLSTDCKGLACRTHGDDQQFQTTGWRARRMQSVDAMKASPSFRIFEPRAF